MYASVDTPTQPDSKTLPIRVSTFETERAYLKRRALAELRATMNANSLEAELAHNGLTGLYLARCRGCLPDTTAECTGCDLRFCCPVGTPSAPLRRAGWVEHEVRYPSPLDASLTDIPCNIRRPDQTPKFGEWP